MVLSGLGYMVGQGEGDTRMRYNDFKFIQGQNSWYTEVDSRTYQFTYHPLDLEDMAVEPGSIEALKNAKMIYLTFDPESEIVSAVEVARMELEQELRSIGIFLVTSVTGNSSLYTNFPKVTCDNATAFVPVIYFTESNTTGISMNGNCVKLSVIDEYGIPALKDRLLYGLFGIM